MPKLMEQEHKLNMSFYCPACKCHHGVSTKNHRVIWDWNNSMDKPTFNPSVRVKFHDNKTNKKVNCHFFITDGSIIYLSDCTHDYAGKTVEMVEV